MLKLVVCQTQKQAKRLFSPPWNVTARTVSPTKRSASEKYSWNWWDSEQWTLTIWSSCSFLKCSTILQSRLWLGTNSSAICLRLDIAHLIGRRALRAPASKQINNNKHRKTLAIISRQRVWGVLYRIFGGGGGRGVQLSSSNPDPISDQNM